MNRSLVSAAWCLALAACHIPSFLDQNWVLRSYDVPEDEAIGLQGELRDLFAIPNGGNEEKTSFKSIARASVAPDGRLVVVGSEEIQAGVADLVAKMVAHRAPQPAAIDATYWLVTGKASKGETTIPSELVGIAPALREVAKQTGPQDFALWEALRVLSGGNNTRSEVGGRHATIKMWASAMTGGGVVLDSQISASRLGEHLLGPNDLKTKVVVAPDQTVVLAQSGFNPAEPLSAPSGNEPPVSLYYLVRATVRNGEAAKR
ncbi:MAG: hypothetical protein ACYDCL_15935 [Myxococcales bacterium]